MDIFEGNIFMYSACERHENQLFCFSIGFTRDKEIFREYHSSRKKEKYNEKIMNWLIY